MQPKTKLILSFFIISIALSGLSRAQEKEPCLAVITEISGKGLVMKAGTNQYTKAIWGTRLFNGDQIITNDKSDIKLLFHDNGIVALGPNRTFKITGEQSTETEPAGDVIRFTSSMGISLSALNFRKEEGKDAGALAGVRLVSAEQTLEPGFPYNTMIKTDRPGFSWFAKISYESYTVNLYNTKGLVWSRKVSGQTMNYPEGEKGLVFGEAYFWYVEGESLIETDKSDNHKFEILAPDKSREVTDHEELIRKTFIETPGCSTVHSVLGAYYIDMGLLQDAIGEFQAIAEINSDAPLPHEILGSLYSDVGEKDKAISELQIALKLSNSKVD